MKRLYIIRHAQAEDPFLNQGDFERNLTNKGIKQAQQAALQLAELRNTQSLTNSLLISSTANRALQTASLFCSTLGWDKNNILYNKNIYEAHYLELLKIINDIPEKYDELILFGHNPGLSELINYLTDDFVNLSTAGIAFLQLDTEIGFSTLSANTAKLCQLR